MTRYCHSVDTQSVDLGMAIALGLEVVAGCGARFVPIADASEAGQFPPCLDCFPKERRRIRGQHRTSMTVRSQFPHYVYRCYDARGRLLYVGCTYNPQARLRQHRADKKQWIRDVARTRFTVWPDRRKALEMERLAIETEHPIFNRAFKRAAS